MSDTKTCTKCGERKVIDEFHKHKQYKNGCRPECKRCTNNRSYEWVRNNKEKAYASRREYAKRNPEKTKEYKKRYREKNINKIRKQSSDWQKANRDKANARYKRWVDNNLGIVAHHSRLRRARHENADGSHTLDEFRELCDRYGWVCLCCGTNNSDKQLTADHVVPLVKGGSNYIDNIQPLCGPCNSSKSIKIIDYRPMFGE